MVEVGVGEGVIRRGGRRGEEEVGGRREKGKAASSDAVPEWEFIALGLHSANPRKSGKFGEMPPGKT